MIFIWLVAGCAVVVTAFFIPSKSGDIWQSVDAAGIAAAVYLLALAGFTTRKPFPLRSRALALIAVVLCLAAMTFSWKSLEGHSRWEREQNRRIVSDFARGSAYAEIQPEMLNVLKLYHHQTPKTAETIGDFFRRMYPSVTPGSGFSRELRSEDPGQDIPPVSSKIYMYVPVISDSEVVIVAQHSQAIGRDEKFKNFNGLLTHGKVQGRWTLTRKGVRYESEN